MTFYMTFSMTFYMTLYMTFFMTFFITFYQALNCFAFKNQICFLSSIKYDFIIHFTWLSIEHFT